MGVRIAPERRTRVDLIVTTLIVVAIVAAGALVWATSSARQSALTTADAPLQVPRAAEHTPRELREAWSHASSVTRTPQLAGTTVVTADGGTVTARNPANGEQVWRYHRDVPLCDALAAWPGGDDLVLAAYRNSRGCSAVTALNGADGSRVNSRSSDADEQVKLSYDGDYVLSAGPTRLETWGTNLVRGIEYGRVSAPVNPENTPGRSNCRLYSALPGENRVAVVERCDGDYGYRLTILGSALDSDEKIIQWGTTMLTTTSHGPAPELIAGSGQSFTVYDGGLDETGEVGPPPGPRVRTFSTQAEVTSQRPVRGLPEAPESSVPVIGSGVVSFWTGTGTVVLDAMTGAPLYQTKDAIGPGAVMAGELLLPIPGGISVRRLSDGREIRSIPVDRHGYDADGGHAVSLRVFGEYVIEQRGDRIVALESP
ncbi:PQQ-binding-like beta-propeller repeat protein [Gordonia zhaorongruii]|uniref:Rv3212 family protein n=1 Tax=Gordonia zhaorongruii TaxID=2597659 RepID=UPI00117F33CE|nr:PQQ-binding-like beta-propeller repeat protein [Gordonia zhaorongruii]